MATLKTPEDIAGLRAAGRLLAEVLQVLVGMVTPGVTTRALDEAARERLAAGGAVPSFLGYRAAEAGPEFPAALCTSVNEQVVHAPPSQRVLVSGDIVGLDLGLAIKSGERWLYVDACRTVPVGAASRTARRLIAVTQEALSAGIAEVAPGKRISDISRAIQRRVEVAGYSVVRQLVGHGVGYAVHEEPQVPNYVNPSAEDVELKPGLVIAIEPMVNVGSWRVKTLPDGWTMVTEDGSLSAHFEHTVVVTEHGHEVLTLPRSSAG